MRLTRLTYVHDGDPGSLGQLLAEVRGVIKFGEGSGLIEVEQASARAAGPLGTASSEVSVRVVSVAYSALAPEVQAELSAGQVPCILGHAETHTAVLVPPRSIARLNGNLSDLRGKIRYGLARVAWTL